MVQNLVANNLVCLMACMQVIDSFADFLLETYFHLLNLLFLLHGFAHLNLMGMKHHSELVCFLHCLIRINYQLAALKLLVEVWHFLDLEEATVLSRRIDSQVLKELHEIQDLFPVKDLRLQEHAILKDFNHTSWKDMLEHSLQHLHLQQLLPMRLHLRQHSLLDLDKFGQEIKALALQFMNYADLHHLPLCIEL